MKSPSTTLLVGTHCDPTDFARIGLIQALYPSLQRPILAGDTAHPSPPYLRLIVRSQPGAL